MQKLKTGRCIMIGFLTLIWLLGFLSSNAHAQSKGFEWSTRISVSEQYDDNIWVAADDEEDDWVTSVTPGLTLTVFTEKTEVNLDYDLSFQWHATNSEYDDVGHSLTLSGFEGIPIAEHLSLDLDETFYICNDPFEPSQEVASVRRTRDRYYKNMFRGRINYLFGEEDVLYGGTHHILLKNDDPNVEDSEGYGGDCGLYYWCNIHHGFGFDYSYTRGDFDVSDDYNQHVGTATYNYRFSPKTGANLSYTYDSIDYQGFVEDYVVHTTTVGLGCDFTDQISSSISGGYYVQDPEESDGTDGFSGTVSFTQRAEKSTLNLAGSTGYRHQFYEAENLGFSNYYRASATLRHQLMERLSTTLSGFYSRDEYQGPVSDREDKTWGGGTALDWVLLRWLSGSLDYQYRQRDSNNAAEEYTDNRVMVKLTAFHRGQRKTF